MSEGDLQGQDVSRETLDRLRIFADVLKKWNPKINLVSKRSLEDLWVRHIADSVQVFKLAPKGVEHWLDIGSGGGFPGVIAAIIAVDESPKTAFTLIESDQRKSAFLRNAARECGVNIRVISKRIEEVEAQNADILSARALADLSDLLRFAELHLANTGIALFPKGENWKKEVDKSLDEWRFDFDPVTSLTEPNAVILKIRGIIRV
ncbi:16S rRNA (guanine(527)-N(7))-methyltransferase RsmG [Epibacterium sp. SM1979]|uniref:Ribosomal RNA small subunit methyltransferase G n=1 Tax=Tritonibacter litoralis TaxID=2662264 RepID=A0A843YFZ8_9RHOB|nr:16S rRNA (guanine(527)-N(7))-methyltransferase RsmG [Tritonibacter litoralis]MQQ08212.1 16S rRNA (guanine(527)-N(7))-methyltransferase RsmG [Tritonibacter litoralis]